jgi:hypothetical protein
MARKDRATKRNKNHRKPLELSGEVRAADLDARQFSLQLDDGTMVAAEFTCEQERTVTEALREHASCRLRLTGSAKVARSGKIKRVDSVESIQIEAAEVPNGLTSPLPVSKEVPADLVKYLDHHLYGVRESTEAAPVLPVDAMAGMIGSWDSGGLNLSERTGKRFARSLRKKKRSAR